MTADPAAVQPGGNFAAAISYGDVTAAGVGTTTVVCDGRALAFGHPFTIAGSTTFSAHAADAVVVQPDQLFGPFKVANLGGVAGLLDQDRLAAVRLRRTNRFASQFDVSFEGIFELLDFLAIVEANPFTDMRFGTVGQVATAGSETFQRYDLKKVQQLRSNRWVDVSTIRIKAGITLNVRLVIGSYRDRLPVLNVDLAYRVPRDKAGARGVLDVIGGLTDFNDDIFFCLFDPEACATSGGAKTLGQLMEKLKARPRNDQLSATLRLNPAPGRPNRAVTTKAVRFLSQVVTGHKVVPVVVVR